MLIKLSGGPYRAPDEFAAAIRARPLQDAVGAAPAVGAFKAADHCISCLRRQVLVAAFAIWTELQHLLPSPLSIAREIAVALHAGKSYLSLDRLRGPP
jgi:hypothetical protein